ncbi:TetR/AcrR family transcriptional regulator [bacterium]|nr:TetR/AcrR family transcriptional regulator [bacterium]
MVQEAGKKIAVTEEEKEMQKQKIIFAAVKVFGSNGYHRSTITQIAQAADMGRGTLYWYFKSKEELFKAIISQIHTDWVEQLEAEVGKSGTLHEKLRSIIYNWLEKVVHHQELYNIFYSVIGETQGDFAEEMHAAVGSLYKSTICILEKLFNQTVQAKLMRPADTHRLARLLVGFIDGMIMQHIFVEPVNPHAMTEVVMNLLFKGLRPEQTVSRDEENPKEASNNV